MCGRPSRRAWQQSVFAHSSGSLDIDLYRDGVRLVVEGGRLVAIDSWRAPVPEDESTAMGSPPLTFVQLLLGYRSLDELTTMFPDVWVRTGKAAAGRHAISEDPLASGAVGLTPKAEVRVHTPKKRERGMVGRGAGEAAFPRWELESVRRVAGLRAAMSAL